MPTPSVLAAAAAAAILATVPDLRSQGPAGLEALLAAFPKEVATLRSGQDSCPNGAAIREAIRRVSAQWDGETSGLYWFTDRAAAQAEARRTGKPVLALRLLGRLDEELSCANSRFFRTALYADERISAELRANWVLLWESERPVPIVTVDLGDGRKIRTTVTGNSIHYVISPDGTVLDALPGLYAPGTFLRTLVAARSGRPLPGAAFLPAAGGPIRPRADQAAPFAATKMLVEAPIVASLLPGAIRPAGAMSEPALARLAARYRDDARLSSGSRALLARHLAPVTPEALARSVALFEEALARDTAQNEALLHPAIRSWLADPALRNDLDALNDRVYTELFRTPASDPWLGLDTGLYAGLRVSR